MLAQPFNTERCKDVRQEPVECCQDNDLSLILGPTWWKERSNPDLSSDFHVHMHTVGTHGANMYTVSNCNKNLAKNARQSKAERSKKELREPHRRRTQVLSRTAGTTPYHSAQRLHLRDPRPLSSSLCGPGHLEGNQVFPLKATRKKTSGPRDFLFLSHTP